MNSNNDKKVIAELATAGVVTKKRGGAIEPNFEAIAKGGLEAVSPEGLNFLEVALQSRLDAAYQKQIDDNPYEKVKGLMAAMPERAALNLVLVLQSPTEKQMAYAEKIAEKAGEKIPEAAMANKMAMREYLDAHTPKPTGKQMELAIRISKRKDIRLPKGIQSDIKTMRTFLNEHTGTRTRSLKASAGKAAEGKEM